jgi:hypothetical protein
VIVHAADRRVDGVDRDVAEGQVGVGVTVGDDVAAALFETGLELERAFLRQGGDVRRRVEDLDVGVLLEIGGGDDARAALFEVEGLGTAAVKLERDLFEVEDDVRHVLDDALERRELMENAFDADGGDGRPFNGREQDAAKRVADRRTEATLERLGGETPVVRGESLGIVIEFFGFLEI